jgi:hypothetical protein
LHKTVHVLTYLLQLCLSKFGINQHSKLPGRPTLSMLTELLPVQFVSNFLAFYQLQHMSEAWQTEKSHYKNLWHQHICFLLIDHWFQLTLTCGTPIFNTKSTF